MFVARSQIELMSKHFIFKTLILVVCVCLWGSLAIAAESPQAVIQTGTDQIVQILKEYPQDSPARRRQIEAVVDKYFDFEAMARLALGSRWNSLSPESQQEFTGEFKRLLFGTYLGDLEKYARQRMTYNTRPIYTGYAVVETRVMDQQGPVTLDYNLHLRNGNWKVFDVAVGGLSLVSNYRNQFDTILANGSFRDLTSMLRQRIAQMCQSGRC